MSHFSALIENEDLRTVAAANTICNETGMDTISAGATLACFSEITGEKLTPERITGLLERTNLTRQGWKIDPILSRPVGNYGMEVGWKVRKRRTAMLDALERHMSDRAEWTRPRGGHAVWLTLPPAVDGPGLQKEAAAAGILYGRGDVFSIDGHFSNCLSLT